MMKKYAVFHLISKHSLNINFLCIFNELLMSLRSALSGSLGSSRDPDVEACCPRGSRDSL